jgi:hypothetical protein
LVSKVEDLSFALVEPFFEASCADGKHHGEAIELILKM